MGPVGLDLPMEDEAVEVDEVVPVADSDLASLTESARAEGMASLRESAIEKLLSGITTYQEVLRVTSGDSLP